MAPGSGWGRGDMKKQVSELEGPALDWAVAEASGRTPQLWDYAGMHVIGVDGVYPGSDPWEVSSDWEQGGRLIDEYNIEIMRAGHDVWAKVAGVRDAACDGRTALEATCRAVVKHMMGDTVDIPEALCT